MSESTRIPVGGGELTQLHCALRPTEAYARLSALLRSEFNVELEAAFIVDGEGRYERDPAWPGSSEGTESALTSIEYQYAGRPLGSLLVKPSDGVGVEELGEFVEEHFAPAYFRAAWLESTLEENARVQEQLHFLREVGALLGVIDLEPLLLNLLELTCGFLAADIGSITLYDSHGELATLVDFGLPHEALLSFRLADGRSAVETSIERGEPLLVDGADLCQPEDVPYRADRLILLPLRTSKDCLGSINLVGEVDSAVASDSALAVVRPAVGLAAIAVENAMLFAIKLEREREQEQLSMARQIQERLLPSHAPEWEGVEFVASSVAATMIGGDYFDYFDLPDGSLGVVVADVAGKGVPAGLIMTAARACFRAAALHQNSPRKVLDRVNHLLCAEDFGQRFVTAVFIRVDLEKMELTLSTAGHEPMLLLRDREVESIGFPALPLGLRDGKEYEQIRLELREGDCLVLNTDGVIDAMNAKRELFGKERLTQTLAGCESQSAQDIHDRILAAVNLHIGETARFDDTTLLVGRVLSSEPKPEDASRG